MPTRLAQSLLLALCCAGGCAWLLAGEQSLYGHDFAPSANGPRHAVLDIFSIRLPPGDPQLSSRVWEVVDEQQFPPDVRRNLEKNGFRVGIIAGQLPPSLSRLLDLKDQAKPNGEAQQVKIADLVTPPRVSSQHMQNRAGQRDEIASSSLIEKMPVWSFRKWRNPRAKL